MFTWAVERDGVKLSVTTERGSGRVTYTIEPSGQPFVADAATVETFRLMEAAAKDLAQAEAQAQQ